MKGYIIMECHWVSHGVNNEKPCAMPVGGNAAIRLILEYRLKPSLESERATPRPRHAPGPPPAVPAVPDGLSGITYDRV
jgi:hypothetical protein